MSDINYEGIELSCLLVQRQWRELVDEFCRLRELKEIDELSSKKFISHLVDFNHVVIDNQDLIIKESKILEVTAEVRNTVKNPPKMKI